MWQRAMMVVTAIILSFPVSGAAQQGPLPVTIAAPIAKEIVDWDEYTGRFEAVETVEVRARVSGYLDEILFRDGEIVQQDQVLFVIDPRPFEARVRVAEADLNGARTRLQLAERELDRADQLLERGNVAEEVRDQRRAIRDTGRTDVLAAEAELRLARLDLEFTRIRAPFTGRISDARIDVGNLIEGGTLQSSLLTTLVSLDPINFTYSISEAAHLKYSRLAKAGGLDSSRDQRHPVFVKLIDETDWSRLGYTDFVDNVISAETGTMRAKALFDNPDLLMTPGLFGRLRVVGSAPYLALLIPDRAIVSDQGNKLVLVTDDDGNVEGRRVQLGPIHEGLRVIKGGLRPGEFIIMRGMTRARLGGTVLPTKMTLEPDGSFSPLDGS